jgi:DNA mismatch endonuclease, patch repair protein
MSRIRGRDTGPELRLRKALWALGFRYRVGPTIEGLKPDVVFTRQRLAVFVDGCQWHGCPLHYVFPRTNQTIWAEKLKGNVLRDQRQLALLRSKGWKVLRFLEHEVYEDLERVLQRIGYVLAQDQLDYEELVRVIRVRPIWSARGADRERRWLMNIATFPSTWISETRRRTTAKWKRPSCEA